MNISNNIKLNLGRVLPVLLFIILVLNATITVADLSPLDSGNYELQDSNLIKRLYRHVSMPELPAIEQLLIESSVQTAEEFSSEQQKQLEIIINYLKENENDAAILPWHKFVKDLKHSEFQEDALAAIKYVLKESYLQSTDDLRFYATKVKYINDKKKSIRTSLREIRQIQGHLIPCDDEMYLGAYSECDRILMADVELSIRQLEEELQSVGEDAQLMNLDLQNVIQAQQQTMQTLSNVSKALHDAAMAIIRNIK